MVAETGAVAEVPCATGESTDPPHPATTPTVEANVTPCHHDRVGVILVTPRSLGDEL